MSSAINHKKRSGYSYANKRASLMLSARRAKNVFSESMAAHAMFADVIRRFFTRSLFHKEG